MPGTGGGGDTSNVCGKWQMTTSENFDAFMGALGVGYVTRKLGNASKPLVTISEVTGEGFALKQESLVKTSEIRFKLDEPFDETTADGRKVKSEMTLVKPNTLMHKMQGTNGGKDSICIREFMTDKMKCTCNVDDISTVRMYDRVK